MSSMCLKVTSIAQLNHLNKERLIYFIVDSLRVMSILLISKDYWMRAERLMATLRLRNRDWSQ